MRKQKFLLLALVLGFSITLTSCEKKCKNYMQCYLEEHPDLQEEELNVTVHLYIYANGELVSTKTTLKNATLNLDDCIPNTIDEAYVLGWYYDAELQNEIESHKVKLTEDLSVYIKIG